MLCAWLRLLNTQIHKKMGSALQNAGLSELNSISQNMNRGSVSSGLFHDKYACEEVDENWVYAWLWIILLQRKAGIIISGNSHSLRKYEENPSNCKKDGWGSSKGLVQLIIAIPAFPGSTFLPFKHITIRVNIATSRIKAHFTNTFFRTLPIQYLSKSNDYCLKRVGNFSYKLKARKLKRKNTRDSKRCCSGPTVLLPCLFLFIWLRPSFYSVDL